MAHTFFKEQVVNGSSSPSLDDSKDELDDDALRYNKRLKERRDRLYSELVRLENENKEHCDKLRDLLKPKQLSNKAISIENDLDAYEESQYQSIALDGFEEFEMQQIKETMTQEQERDFQSLLIRFLSLSNAYQRNEIKSLYAKQTSLYFQAQGLSLDEQRSFHDALSVPKTHDKQKRALIQQILGKYPDPHQISDEYEKYVKCIRHININAKDEDDLNWQSSVMDEQKTNTEDALPSLSTTLSPSGSAYSSSLEESRSKTKKSGLFRFKKRKSLENDNSDTNRVRTETAASAISITSITSIDTTAGRSTAYTAASKQSVDIMGHEANAPMISAETRHTGISGARLIRFDANYKRLSNRRKRCDVATIISALQNTHNMHTKMKHRVLTMGQNPFLREQNYGFDHKYSNGKVYVFDTILYDKDRLRRHKEDSVKANDPMTPAMHSYTATLSASKTFALNALDILNEKQEDDIDISLTPIMRVDNKKEPSWNDKKERKGWITLNQFIHLATSFGAHGQRDAQVLVLTHKTFCNSLRLLRGLRSRFWIPIPPNITPSEMSAYRSSYVKKIRGKIIAVLRFWLTKHWNADFRGDLALQRKMNKFIAQINQNEEAQAMSIWLAQAFERQKKENVMGSTGMLVDRELQEASIAQKKKVVKFFYDTKTIDILDFKPSETAACITELNCASFLLIDQRECFEWIKHKEAAPHVASMIARWNAMGNWAQRELLSRKRDFKKRLQSLKYFIQIVNILSDWGDFSGAYAINSALVSTPVHRLKGYFAELTRKEHQILNEMRELFAVSGNYPNLRAKMKNYLSKPCVPHIGLFTRDFTMLAEQKSTKMIANTKYINFGKCQALAKQIGDLKMYQNNINKFDLKYQKPLRDYVETQLENPLKSDSDLYNISVLIEPKANNV